MNLLWNNFRLWDLLYTFYNVSKKFSNINSKKKNHQHSLCYTPKCDIGHACLVCVDGLRHVDSYSDPKTTKWENDRYVSMRYEE